MSEVPRVDRPSRDPTESRTQWRGIGADRDITAHYVNALSTTGRGQVPDVGKPRVDPGPRRPLVAELASVCFSNGLPLARVSSARAKA